MSLAKAASFLVPRTVGKVAVRRTHRHIQATLPTEKHNKVEKTLLTSAIIAGVLAYPTYVVFHLQEWNPDDRWE